MKKYIPSTRDVPGLKRAPVLAETNLSGEWIPPMEVYIARDVDTTMKEMKRLLQFVLDKSDKPMWLSDGWRDDTRTVLTRV